MYLDHLVINEQTFCNITVSGYEVMNFKLCQNLLASMEGFVRDIHIYNYVLIQQLSHLHTSSYICKSVIQQFVGQK